jgi:hypothetical protein
MLARAAAALLGLPFFRNPGLTLAGVPLDLKKVTGPSGWLGTSVSTTPGGQLMGARCTGSSSTPRVKAG